MAECKNAKWTGGEPPPPARRRLCPICGKPSTTSAAPFCSKRCADIDLHRWLGGTYVVSSDEEASTPGDERRANEE